MAIGETAVVAFCRTEAATATIAYRVGGYGSTMTAKGPWGELTAEGQMGFDTLRELRLKLEELGWRLAVNGARLDVFCFGPVRNMTNGMYVSLMGDDRDDAHVALFGAADPRSIATVAEQDEFFDIYFRDVEADDVRERLRKAHLKRQESKA
jgi:hypothetical protein